MTENNSACRKKEDTCLEQKKIKVGIIGPGNIGTDLMYKVMRSPVLEMSVMMGIVDSEGIKRAQKLGFATALNGVNYLEEHPEMADIVLDATTARAHIEIAAPVLDKLGKVAIDLTPAAVGKMVTPMVNMNECIEKKLRNANLITCGGQATTPIVWAIHNAMDIQYAEVVTAVASESAGIGTRRNIDEYTRTTAKALRDIGGAETSKVMTVFTPALPEPPMRNTIYCIPKDPDKVDLEAIRKEVYAMVESIKTYVPGYELTLRPVFDAGIVTTTVSIYGQGDFLPPFAGNLDMETSSAVKVAELYAEAMLKGAF